SGTGLRPPDTARPARPVAAMAVARSALILFTMVSMHASALSKSCFISGLLMPDDARPRYKTIGGGRPPTAGDIPMRRNRVSGPAVEYRFHPVPGLSLFVSPHEQGEASPYDVQQQALVSVGPACPERRMEIEIEVSGLQIHGVARLLG